MGLLAAVQFLTRLPVRRSTRPDLAAAVLWFPVVGALIGAVVGGAAAGLGELAPDDRGRCRRRAARRAGDRGVPRGRSGRHGRCRRRRLDASSGGWRSSRTRGTAPTASPPSAARSSCASSPWAPWRRRRRSAGSSPRTPSVVVRPSSPWASSRWPARTASAPTTPARSDRDGHSPAASWRSSSPPRPPGWWAGPLALAAAVGTLAVVRVAVKALGGITGDVLGAVEQVGECLVLVVVSGLASRHELWWA